MLKKAIVILVLCLAIAMPVMGQEAQVKTLAWQAASVGAVTQTDSLIFAFPKKFGYGNPTLVGYAAVGIEPTLVAGTTSDSLEVWIRTLHYDSTGTAVANQLDSIVVHDNLDWTDTFPYFEEISSAFPLCNGFITYFRWNTATASDSLKISTTVIVQ